MIRIEAYRLDEEGTYAVNMENDGTKSDLILHEDNPVMEALFHAADRIEATALWENERAP